MTSKIWAAESVNFASGVVPSSKQNVVVQVQDDSRIFTFTSTDSDEQKGQDYAKALVQIDKIPIKTGSNNQQVAAVIYQSPQGDEVCAFHTFWSVQLRSALSVFARSSANRVLRLQLNIYYVYERDGKSFLGEAVKLPGYDWKTGALYGYNIQVNPRTPLTAAYSTKSNLKVYFQGADQQGYAWSVTFHTGSGDNWYARKFGTNALVNDTEVTDTAGISNVTTSWDCAGFGKWETNEESDRRTWRVDEEGLLEHMRRLFCFFVFCFFGSWLYVQCCVRSVTFVPGLSWGIHVNCCSIASMLVLVRWYSTLDSTA